MTINLGMTKGQMQAFQRLLTSHHYVFFRAQTLNMNHQYLSDVSHLMLDGQVTVDADAEVTRSLSLELIDDGSVTLDTNSPSGEALFADRMIRVYFGIMNPTGTVSYTCPVFTGPLVKLTRNGGLLSLECQGKESLGLGEPWVGATYNKGWNYTSVIKNILNTQMGESSKYIEIPHQVRGLPRPVSLGVDRKPWLLAKDLAKQIGYQLYYDGYGTVRYRKFPTGSSYRFFEGEGGSILSSPSIGFNTEDLYNAIEVTGAKPQKGKTKQPLGRAIAPRTHPLSPWSLGRNTVPRYLVKRIQDDAVINNQQAATRAKQELDRSLLQSVEVSFDSLPIPMLEELDICEIRSSSANSQFALKKFTIPLNGSGVSTIGYVRNVKVYRRAARQLAGSR